MKIINTIKEIVKIVFVWLSFIKHILKAVKDYVPNNIKATKAIITTIKKIWGK